MNIQLAVILAAGIGAYGASAEIKPLVISDAPFPLTVSEWTPPERDFPVAEYGTVSSSKPITEAIAKAIDAAHAAGGGRVVLPKGEWLTGGLTLKGNIALVVPEGSTLRFPDDPVIAYGAPLRADGRPKATRRGLIEAVGCTNVAIMGKGTLKADVEYWHRNFSFNPQKGYPRPQFFSFRNCKNVRFEGFKIRGSPAWTMHFTLCQDIVLRDVDSIATGPNTDGLDLDSCDRALVERVSLDQTDDTFTIKSGMNAAGRKRNVPTQNVVIRNCRAVHGHSLLGIGSEVSGGIRNIFMTDCTVADECWRWIFVKTNSKRGAFVENVTLQNITGRRASQAVMEVTMYYDGNPNKELTKSMVSEFPTRINGIVCRNITCAEAGAAVRVQGDPALPPAGMLAEDIAVGRLRKANSKLVVTNAAAALVLKNVRLEASAFGCGLGLPAQVRRFDAERDGNSEVVIDRAGFEERADNEVVASVLDARIAAECRTQRNCVPRMVPAGRDYAAKSFSPSHVDRMEAVFADLGCAFEGAIVADDVRNVSCDGKSVVAALSVDAAQGTARLTLTNRAAEDATDLFVVFYAPAHYMTHRQVFRVDRVAAGGSRTIDIELGAGAHYMPPPQGVAPFAAQVDFSQAGMRSRVWCRAKAPNLGARRLPNDTTLTMGPIDAKAADDATLCELSSALNSQLSTLNPQLSTLNPQWRSAAFPGAAGTVVSGPARPYTEAEQKLVRTKRAVEIAALDFEVPAFAAVKLKFFAGKRGSKAAYFLNGKLLEKEDMKNVLPTRAGRNRLLVRYPAAPGANKECAHLSVYTWSAINYVPCVPIVESAAQGEENEDIAAVTELLSIPSITKDVAANDRVTEWMKAYLEKRGVWCTLETLPKDGRKILYAATQKGLLNPDYIMVTHLDVVDAPPEMFAPKIKDGKIYARGACDTKVNAFCAAKTLVRLNGKSSIACIFASDEEAGGYTSKYMVSRGYGVPGKMVVTLDCANLTPDIRYCCKGNGYYKVTAVGKSGHSSVPDQCVNPIYILAEAALKLRDKFPFQKPGEWGDVASVTVINSGDSFNRIPETAEMIVNVRFVEMDGLERHRKTIADITGLKTELVRGTLPGLGPNDAPDILRLQAVMKRMYPERSANLVRSLAATDARYFTQFKKPIPMFAMTCDGGHSACEWCELKDIDRFTALLVEVMEK